MDAIFGAVYEELQRAAAKEDNEEGSFATYQNLAKLVAPVPDLGDYSRLFHILEEINVLEWFTYHRHMLSAVAVDENERKPGQGFYNCAEKCLHRPVGKSDRDRDVFWVRELTALRNEWRPGNGRP